MRSWIGIAIAGAVLSASGCGDGARTHNDGPPSEDELTAHWGGVMLGAQEEGFGAASADSTDEKSSLLQYPVVIDAPTPEVRDRLRAALSLDSALGLSLQRYREELRAGRSPTINVSHRITYQREHLLDVRYRLEVLGGGGPARYGVRHRVIDLRTGERVRAARAFRPDALPELASLVDERIQEGTDGERYSDASDAPRFRVEDLGNFSIDDRGVTFFLEFSFPHVFMEGPLDAFLPWDELRPYIRRDGPLEPFV